MKGRNTLLILELRYLESIKGNIKRQNLLIQYKKIGGKIGSYKWKKVNQFC